MHIRDLGVIEGAVAEFAGGLTVVTGETGAGKTMVVSSLRLLSGERADASRVRVGSDKASVEGYFVIPAGAAGSGSTGSGSTDSGNTSTDSALGDLLREIDAEIDDGEVIAGRTVSAAGRSRAHLGGKAVPVGVLGRFAQELLTIHGQNDQLRLLDSQRQLEALDNFAGLDQLRAEFQAARKLWRGVAKQLHERLESRTQLALEAETLTQALALIDEVDPQPGEDDELKARIRRLQDVDDLRGGVAQALAVLDGTDVLDAEASNVLSLLQVAVRALDGDDEQLRGLADRLEELAVLVGDVASDVARVLDEVPDPAELDGLLQRQQQLRALRKFAADVDGALAWRDSARERLSNIDVSEDAIAALQEEVEQRQAAMLALARELTKRRTAAAKDFGAAVTEQIRGLFMSSAVEVDVRPFEGKALGGVQVGSSGADVVEFMLVQGGHRTSLAASASGGELSRIMLALEVVLVEKVAVNGRTMVFDEVDAGVGGKAAVEIGRRLAQLAVNNQVIVVTHLPQVAAFADSHVYVDKLVEQSSVRSSVRTLSRDERVEELARMLAGLESDSGRAHAEELLVMAEEFRRA